MVQQGCPAPARLRALSLVAVLGVLAACSSATRAPIEQLDAPAAPARMTAATVAGPGVTTPATVHTVVRGDTVHGIAWRYRLDHRDLIRWNGLANPNLIQVGQRLRLTPPPVRARPASPAPATAPRVPAPMAATRPAPTPAPAPVTHLRGPLHWQWPASGKTTRADTIAGVKGLEIRGQRGQQIKAAAPGTVVYSGSGLRGYGELIILQHNDTFLSAYAHNEARLVQEGSRVAAGETIARMGDTDTKDVMLHFEIRRNGKAVDPLQYLPRR